MSAGIGLRVPLIAKVECTSSHPSSVSVRSATCLRGWRMDPCCARRRSRTPRGAAHLAQLHKAPPHVLRWMGTTLRSPTVWGNARPLAWVDQGLTRGGMPPAGALTGGA
ncbi:uncharacterized protein STAUR_8262 [Stigmatella aurantiaca DW4/3-1]|uniref:Uncharacterized protein n=1 Tax=Stigmatella aurantiaca (strain DW4/3-1) TaxID=378806 RepID=E3FWB1_STIAD|nr:uncharacterized protein STAUR_8262 [Stigmatella aurantiaca DW4/3-1]